MHTSFKRFASLAVMTGMLSPLALSAQSYSRHESYATRHERARRAQIASDHRHHTGAKIVVGSAAGGALIGGLAGGGKGALIGGALGAGGGALVNKHRQNNDIKAREREGRY